MRWARFEHEGKLHFGVVDGDVIEVADGHLFDAPVLTGRRIDLAQVRLLAPIVPATFYAVGLNYMTHVRRVPGRQPPQRPEIGYRANNALIGPNEAIFIPGDSAGKLQFEAELVVVIGHQAKNLTRENALSCVFGYTIGNDVSERQWQKEDRTLWRAKNCDSFKPMGPWIETDVDPAAMMTTVHLNGEKVSQFQTHEMIFSVVDYLVAISRYITLHPGDVIWMGTDEPTLDMVDGDTVEIEISGIGVLTNPVRSAGVIPHVSEA
jgi:2-keto-4-pentenoate hydratase/2-oxohepta-3-ene-1,7-dioic acid hydratase in catechol pathway